MGVQVNLRLPENLLAAAKNYAASYGFKNVQELALEALREKVIEKAEFDMTFTPEEVALIEQFTALSIKKRKLRSEEEIFKKLR